MRKIQPPARGEGERLTNLRQARKILYCLRYGIGDLIMELPALEALRQAVPAARLTALGARPAIELLAGDRRIDSLLAVQDFGLTHWGDPGNQESRSRIGDWLEEESFDLFLDPSHAARGLAEAIWARRRSIYDAGPELQNAALQRGGNGGAAVLAAVRAGWGIAVPPAFPSLELTAAERLWANRFRVRRGLPAAGTIAVSPVASSPLKCWPAERFSALLQGLLADNRGPVLLFCGPQEEGAAILKTLGRPREVVPAGALPLRQVAALLAGCRAFIGHDTGLMHLAAAVGVSSAALFGPTSPEIYLPAQVPAVALGGRDGCPHRRRFAFGPPRCVVEGGCLAGRRSCIDDIGVAEVLAAVRHLLADQAGSGEREEGHG